MWCQFYHKGEGERIISCVSYSRYVTSLPRLGQERYPKGGEVELYSIITAESPAGCAFTPPAKGHERGGMAESYAGSAARIQGFAHALDHRPLDFKAMLRPGGGTQRWPTRRLGKSSKSGEGNESLRINLLNSLRSNNANLCSLAEPIFRWLWLKGQLMGIAAQGL